jgi:hypothetical protein
MIREFEPHIAGFTGRDGTVPIAEPTMRALEPHESIKLDGVLCAGRSAPLKRSNFVDLVLPPVTEFVRQVVDWSGFGADPDRYFGEYRFLVLDMRTESGVDTFVQIWSEPFSEVLTEVGPGNRPNPLLQRVADGMREALLDRGFTIGGNANNYLKRFPAASSAQVPCIAREMVAILLDVLTYDGRSDLLYQWQQASRLKNAHVLTEISRDDLCTLLQRWGLRATESAENVEVIEAASLEQEFPLQLHCPHPQRRGEFWERHCLATLSMAADATASVVETVNGRPFLMKAHVTTSPGDILQSVRLAAGINLAGGVTYGHVRAQIAESLQVVRRLTTDRSRGSEGELR